MSLEVKEQQQSNQELPEKFRSKSITIKHKNGHTRGSKHNVASSICRF